MKLKACDGRKQSKNGRCLMDCIADASKIPRVDVQRETCFHAWMHLLSNAENEMSDIDTFVRWFNCETLNNRLAIECDVRQNSMDRISG